MSKIYCTNSSHGTHTFYLEANGETHYLFSQSYKRGVREYFGKGVHLDAAMDFSRAKKNVAVLHTMQKLPSYIKYVEKAYDLQILRQTSRKKERSKKRAA